MLVLAVAGAHGLGFTLPVTLAIAALLGFLTFSYRQVIAAFPNGGGAYAVAGKYLGRHIALVAAASLVIDYILNVAVSVSAGVAALTSAYPALYGDGVLLCLAALALITGVNLRGVAEPARLFIVPTVAFIAAIGAVIAAGLLRSHPATAPSAPPPAGAGVPAPHLGDLVPDAVPHQPLVTRRRPCGDRGRRSGVCIAAPGVCIL